MAHRESIGGMNLGSVKVDLKSKERLYSDLFLSDIDVLQLLLEYRHKYDKYSGFCTNNAYSEAGTVADLNQEIIVTYSSIDCLIKQCKFSKEQMKILEMIEQGYVMKEIADEFGLRHENNIRQRINKILRDIAKMNEWNWRKSVYIHKLELKTKKCSKCKEDLPATDEFYTFDSTNNVYKSACRICRS